MTEQRTVQRRLWAEEQRTLQHEPASPAPDRRSVTRAVDSLFRQKSEGDAGTMAQPIREPDNGECERLDDPAAFGAFYERAVPRIYGYFYHRCGGASGVAEELTQETFLAAVTVIRSGRPIGAPLPWLFGIARHKLIDHYRREARREVDKPVSWEAWQVGRDDSGESDFASAPWDEGNGQARTQAALRSVPVVQRQALTLRYLDGLSVPEVAAALGRGIHATESLLARGRVGFKRAYAEASDDD